MAIEAQDLGTLAQPSNLTFWCQFTAQESDLRQEAGSRFVDELGQPVPAESLCWKGTGSGRAHFGKSEGLVGANPSFELCKGWLTLIPTQGSAQSLSPYFFSGFELTDPPWQTRDLKSYSVYVGEGLQSAMRLDDTLTFSRGRAEDFTYSLVRNSDVILSAGSVGKLDAGGSVAAWQEYDRQPNQKLDDLRKPFPYVTVRVKDQVFLLVDGDHVHVDQHYVFLARSTKKPKGIGFIPPQAVCSTGHLDVLRKELIRDAAHQLTAPQTLVL